MNLKFDGEKKLFGESSIGKQRKISLNDILRLLKKEPRIMQINKGVQKNIGKDTKSWRK